MIELIVVGINEQVTTFLVVDLVRFLFVAHLLDKFIKSFDELPVKENRFATKFDFALAAAIRFLRFALKLDDIFGRIELRVLFRSVRVSALKSGGEIPVVFPRSATDIVKDPRARFIIRLSDERKIADPFHARPEI